MPDVPSWDVRWLGDPDYGGCDAYDDALRSQEPTIVQAVEARDAVAQALSRWRQEDDEPYGDGTVVGVREVVQLPPVRRFSVRDGGYVDFDTTIASTTTQKLEDNS